MPKTKIPKRIEKCKQHNQKKTKSRTKATNEEQKQKKTKNKANKTNKKTKTKQPKT